MVNAKTRPDHRAIWLCMVLVSITFRLSGQTLNETLSGTLSKLLNDRLEHNGPVNYFSPERVQTSLATMRALNSFLTANVTDMPTASTMTGLIFDFRDGKPIASSNSMGSVFAERAPTLGRGRLNFGITFSHAGFNRLRGIPLEDLRLTFAHADIAAPGRGDVDSELDKIDVWLNLSLDASVVAFLGTFGITNQLDIGIVVPLMAVKLGIAPYAVINSFTYNKSGQAEYYFGGGPFAPELSTRVHSTADEATGLGDISLRAKYNFVRGLSGLDIAALGELRLPTGNPENLTGSGGTAMRMGLISSTRLGSMEPHINIFYEWKSTPTDRDEWGVVLGYDQRVSDQFAVSIDFFGDFETGTISSGARFPESVTTRRAVFLGAVEHEESLNNIPDYGKDHYVNLSLGFKYRPRATLMFLGNLFFPMNNSGIRSQIIPTIGLEFSL